MTTERSTSHRSTKKASSGGTTKKSTTGKSAKSSHAAHSAATKRSLKGPKAEQTSRCWPGYEPVPGKERNEKGSCKPKSGKQPKSVRRADQKAAAASKLQKTRPR